MRQQLRGNIIDPHVIELMTMDILRGLGVGPYYFEINAYGDAFLLLDLFEFIHPWETYSSNHITKLSKI